jgi:hypothetical protein
MRVRLGVIAVPLFVVVGFVSSASACEKCIDASTPGWKQCSSGYASGVQSCSGGFGVPCAVGPACGSGGGGGVGDDGPFSPDYLVSGKPCLTCTGAEPDQGFILQNGEAPPETLAVVPVQRGKPTRSSRR